MPTLFKIGSRAKGVLILAAWIVAHLHRILQALVKIFDDSEVDTTEALQFVTTEGPIWVGEWKGRKGDGDAAPSTSAATSQRPQQTAGFDAGEFAKAVAEEAVEDATEAIFKRRK